MESVTKALEYLTKAGHKVSRATFYRHRLEGAIAGPPFLEQALLKYAEEFLKEKKDRRRIVSSQAAELKKAVLEKTKATAQYSRLRTEKLRGDLISKKEIEMIYSQACLRMLTALKYFGFSAGPDMCEFFNGDPNKIQDFIYIWPEYVQDWMADFMSGWQDQGEIKNLPKISMSEILKYYEDIAATHGGRDIEE